jgi:hypothetical protein
MAVCWSRDPKDRPSAAEIELYARRPEFCALRNAVAVAEDVTTVICACSVLREVPLTSGTCHNSLLI